MNDHPIIFSAPMIRALLEGRKTQTRRIIKNVRRDNNVLLRKSTKTKMGITTHVIDLPEYPHLLPIRAAIGNRLWVRETWSAIMTGGWTIADARSGLYRSKIVYRADGSEFEEGDGWWPSIHMPREFSRIALTVTDVRVQRLKDISENDAWAEGCKKGMPTDNGNFFPADEPDPSGKGERGWDCAYDWFNDLWNSIHGHEAWEANPWVAVYTFTVEHKNIDKAAA